MNATPQTTLDKSETSKSSSLKRSMTVVLYGGLIVLALLEFGPFILTLSNSFKCLPAIQAEPQALIPLPPFGVDCRLPNGASLPASATTTRLTFNPGLEGYRRIFQFNLDRWLINSVIYSVSVTLLRLIIDSLAGYALARIRFPGNRVLFFLILGTMMIPGIVLVIPRFLILKELSLLNTYQGLIFALAADAFGVFLMKQFFESVPKEIEEAAFVDGANRLTLFFRVVMPMATPALTALAIFSFQGTWNAFLDPLIIVGGDQDLLNLPLGLALLRGQFGDTLEWNVFLAGSVITTLPLALVFFFFQRYFVQGISYSGLKG
ncbi:MAG: carbohydrate ABC transporter permease [Deinococcota bacterium]